MTEQRGRVAERPSFVASSGYRIAYRHLAPETQARLLAAAERQLAETRPALPTQRLETAPGEWRDVDNPHDPAYQSALAAWRTAVQARQGELFLRFCEDYALIYDIDADEVAALRAAHAAVGDPLDESDAAVFLWKIALPTPDDQMTLIGKLFGGLTEEAIQAQKASFCRNLQGPAAGAGARPPAGEPAALPGAVA